MHFPSAGLRPCLAFALLATALPLPAAVPAPATGEVALHKWSGDLNVPDPVAPAVDPQGRVYVAATTRRKVGDLDIREHRMWIPDDVALDSVQAKSDFFKRELAQGKLRQPRGELRDHNGDGSIDWLDLTHHTERIYQLRDTDGDGTADRMTVFAEGFNTEVTGIAAGVMWHDGWLYATIAPDLWRFKDVDDDGVADLREKLVSGFGIHIAYAGHDMHGLSVGPDGRIYWSIGDKGAHVVSREGRQFYLPNEGAVFRIEPDGSHFEVYARGLRNPQEPAFDDFGHLLTVDNDADMQGERERFVYIVEGSDSGWRCNFQYMSLAAPWMREGLWRPHFPGQPAYLLPPISSYSDGPAGFRYDPGTALGSGQRHHFILSEFPSGKLRAFRAEPDGASFAMVDERTMHLGVMGIGLSWHPDGSLMMVDWIGGYPLNELGAIWQVDATAGREEAARRETHALMREGMGARPVDALVSLLAHRDQRVRLEAQFELVRRGRADDLLAATRRPHGDRADLLARVHGLWGAGQLLRHQKLDTEALRPFLSDADPEIRAQAAKVLGDAGHAAPAAGAVARLLEDPSPRVRLQAAIALGKWGASSAAPALFAFAARDGADPTLRTAAFIGLAGAAHTADLAARSGDPSREVRLASVVALRRRQAPAVAAFLQDRDPLVVAEAARAIHDDTSIPAALPALAGLLAKAPGDEMTVRRALNANLRLGTPEAAARLADYALAADAPKDMRREALESLLVWNEPPRLDRVDGYARTYAPQPAADVLGARLDALLALTDNDLKTLAVKVMIAHQLDATASQMASILSDGEAPADLRSQALGLMAARHGNDPAFARALDAALAPAAPDALFRTAIAQLASRQPERLVTEVRRALAERDSVTRQLALGLLAKVGLPSADAVLAEQGAALLAGNVPAALQLDLLQALEQRRSALPAIESTLAAYAASPAAAARQELLAGGDPIRGRDLSLNHLGANCLACHRIESAAGSAVGPVLRSIGRDRDAAYLLESLIAPAATIAPGYGFVSLTLKDGSNAAGTLAKETPETVTVRLPDGAEQSVARRDIATFTPPISVMPSMEGILQPDEIRDVVAYLQSLNGRR
jgi:putative membrane-bound dehydrogenase-like protein